MATSGVRDQTETVHEIVKSALQKLFVVEAEQSPEAEDMATGLKALRRMLRSWAVKDVRLWLVEDQAVTVAVDTASYTLSPRALDIYGAFLRDSNGNDTPIDVMTREQYNRLPDKSASGEPYAVWMDRRTTSSVLTVYPVPSSAGSTLYVTVKRMIEDVTSTSEDVEVPAEWVECIIFNLAVRMASDFGVEPSPVVYQMAMELFEELAAHDREGSVMFRAAVY